MTTETSNARGEAEYEYEVWQGDAWQAGGSTTDYASAKSEADHYAMMCGQDGPVEVRIYEKRLLAAAPPPAAARGDVRGLVAKWRTLANDAMRRSGTWNGNDLADRIEFMADELESALAAEGVQAGEVEQRAGTDEAMHWIDRYAAGIDSECQIDRIASALSQQPEARGVADEDEVFRLAAGSHYGAEPNSYWDMDRDALLAFARAITGERNG